MSAISPPKNHLLAKTGSRSDGSSRLELDTLKQKTVWRRLLLVLICTVVALDSPQVRAQTPLFTFAHISDSQASNSTAQARFEEVLDTLVDAGQPGALIPLPVQFVLFAGDLVDDGTDQAEWMVFVSTMNSRLTANGIPYRAVPGNHDREGGGAQTNYETYIADSDVWDTGVDSLTGHNGLTVNLGMHGIRFIGFNNSNPTNNRIASLDLSKIDLLATNASTQYENIFLLSHHPHGEGGSIPLAQTLQNPDVVGYMRGHLNQPHAEAGLSGVNNPNVWDLNSNSMISKAAFLYYEVFSTEILVYPVKLTEDPSSLPTPVTIPLVHPVMPLGPATTPTANFTALPLAGDAPLEVTFTDQSSDLPTSWLWDFGDGATSTLKNPSHIYGEGVFDVTLTVTNEAGSDMLEKVGLVTVEPAPPTVTFLPAADARVSSSKPTTNYGTDDHLRVRSGTPTYDSYLMFEATGLGDSSVVAATLRLYVTDSSDEGGGVYLTETDWTELGITWNTSPGGTALGSLGSVSAGTWAEFDVLSVIQGNGLYSFGLTSDSSNSAYFSSREGANPPQLVLETGPAIPPVAEFSADPVSGLMPLVVQFMDQSSSGPNAWSWDFGDGTGSAEQSPSHTYTNHGTYTVSLEVSNSAGDDTETKVDYVVVEAPDPPSANFSAISTSGPAPFTVSFSDLSSGEPTAWLWDFGDGDTSTLPSPTHTYTVPGTYAVSLLVSNGFGQDTLIQADYIHVQGAPVIAQSFSPSTIGTGRPTTITFTIDNSTNAVPLTGASFTDSYVGGPTDMVNSTPLLIGGTCANVETTAVAGGTSFDVTSAEIPAGDSCTITVVVVGASASGTNTTSLLSSNEAPNSVNGASATLTVAPLLFYDGFESGDTQNWLLGDGEE